MPSYEFRCPVCNNTEVIVRSIHEENTAECKNCHVTMLKVFASPPISFMGGGWASKE